jgi:hypothetical protein
MSDGIVTIFMRGQDWTIKLESRNGPARLKCRPGWKNRNHQKGPYPSMTEGVITPHTEEVLDQFLDAISEIFLVHIKGPQEINVVFNRHFVRESMRSRIACEVKRALGWDNVEVKDGVADRSFGKLTRY